MQVNTPITQLTLAAAALRDLDQGFPPREIAANRGTGLPVLVQELVAYLASQGALDSYALMEYAKTYPQLHLALAEALVVPDFDPVLLVIEANALDDNGDGPPSVSVELTQHMLRDIIHKARGLQGVGLEYGNDSGWDHVWDDEESHWRMRGTDLVICANEQPSFWFNGHPKHCDYHCESRAIDIVSLLKALSAMQRGEELPHNFELRRGVLFFASEDTEDFSDTWLEYNSKQLAWTLYHPGQPVGQRFWNEDDGWTDLAGATRYGSMPQPDPTYPLGGMIPGEQTPAQPFEVGAMCEFVVVLDDGTREEAFGESEAQARNSFQQEHPDLAGHIVELREMSEDEIEA